MAELRRGRRGGRGRPLNGVDARGPGTGLNRWARRAALLSILLAACPAVLRAADAPPASPDEAQVDLSAHFPGIDRDDATFVVSHPASGRVIRHNPRRAGQRFLPASTFKIANSLIALDTGVATGADHAMRWDPALQPAEGFWAADWSKDHTLRSAMRSSVFWFHQALARGIGPERMQAHLDRFAYGNRDMGGGADRFWLHGALRISPDEQVRFLERMYHGRLGVSDAVTRTVRDLLVLEDAPGWRISGKTGTADVTATREMAWLVGYVERDGDTWFYALNLEGEPVWEQWGPPGRRLDLVRGLLRALAVLPGPD